MEERVGGSAVFDAGGSAVFEASRKPRASRNRPNVLVAIRDMALHQEVLDFLERDHRIQVRAAVADPSHFLALWAEPGCDVALACPQLAREAGGAFPPGAAHGLVLVCEEMTVPVLREAIDLGARGVFSWPEERDELVEVLVRAGALEPSPNASRARVLAVLGARGGAGSTFVASQLVAAAADLGTRGVIVDLDAAFSGLTVALGLRPDGQDQRVRTMADLVPVLGELESEHLEQVLFRHPRGFDALLGPASSDPAEITPGLVQAAIALLAGSHGLVVLHVPRALDPVALTGIRMADEVILVTTQDLFSLYGAKRAMGQLELDRPPERCRVLLNRFARGHLGPADVARVLGVRPWAAVRADPAVRKAQDLGQLLPPRSRRAGRDVRVLARHLLEEGEGTIPSVAGRGDGKGPDRVGPADGPGARAGREGEEE